MNRQHEAAHNRSCVQQLSPRWRPMTGVWPVKVSGLGWRPNSLRESWLWLLCLAIFTVTLTDSKNCSRETIKHVETVLREVQMKPFDCNLYTPGEEDYEQNCPNSTLTCFANEAEVLMYEGANKKWNLKNRLVKLIHLITKKDKDGCSRCEFYPEKAAKDFLESLKYFLQQDCAGA